MPRPRKHRSRKSGLHGSKGVSIKPRQRKAVQSHPITRVKHGPNKIAHVPHRHGTVTMPWRKRVILWTVIGVAVLILFGLILYFVLNSFNQDPGPPPTPMKSNETIEVDKDQGYLVSPNYPRPYPAGGKSIARFLRNDGGTKLTFLDLQLPTTNLCERDNITIIGSIDDMIALFMCGDQIPEPVVVQGPFEIRLRANRESSSSRGFKIKFEPNDGNGCASGMFKCRNRRCIDDKLVANGNDDCGDASDENGVDQRLNPQASLHYNYDFQCGQYSGSGLPRLRTGPDYRLKPEDRITEGHAVDSIGKWTPMVSLQMTFIEPIGHICGGSLIHPQIVLTAAHCIAQKNMSSIRVVLGATNLKDGYRNYQSNHVQVRYSDPRSFAVHPKYPHLKWVLSGYDIAILKLNAPVRITSAVAPACLPRDPGPATGARQCMTAGFGDTLNTGDPKLLNEVRQTVVPTSMCLKPVNTTDPPSEVLFDYLVCSFDTENELKGPCFGDSGGPIACPKRMRRRRSVASSTSTSGQAAQFSEYEFGRRIKNTTRADDLDRITVIGVTQTASGPCRNKGAKGFFTRVFMFKDWIKQRMDEQLNTNPKIERETFENVFRGVG